jgi:sugar O-acyltransferase (sialic acid O-acetyltransferase NeuD family)
MEGIQFNKLKVILVGAGGLAREISSWNSMSKNKMDIISFWDDYYKPESSLRYGIDVINSIEFYEKYNDYPVIMALSNCQKKEEIYQEYSKNDVNFTNFIHESVLIGQRTLYGLGLVTLPNVVISCDVKIGNLVFINNGSQIGHDVEINDFVSIMANVDIGGGAKLGKNVFIGSNAVILPGVSITDNTVIGTGSVVIKSIKQSGTYFGNPAKKIF